MSFRQQRGNINVEPKPGMIILVLHYSGCSVGVRSLKETALHSAKLQLEDILLPDRICFRGRASWRGGERVKIKLFHCSIHCSCVCQLILQIGQPFRKTPFKVAWKLDPPRAYCIELLETLHTERHFDKAEQVCIGKTCGVAVEHRCSCRKQAFQPEQIFQGMQCRRKNAGKPRREIPEEISKKQGEANLLYALGK